MPKKADEEKLTGKVLLPLGEPLEKALRRIARDSKSTPQNMLREAVEAFIRYAAHHGGVVPRGEIDIRPHQHAPVTDAEVTELLRLVRDRYQRSDYQEPAESSLEAAETAPADERAKTGASASLAAVETAALELELKRRRRAARGAGAGGSRA